MIWRMCYGSIKPIDFKYYYELWKVNTVCVVAELLIKPSIVCHAVSLGEVLYPRFCFKSQKKV